MAPGRIRLGLRPVDRAVGVLRRSVHGVQLEVGRTLVNEIVAQPSGDVDESAGRELGSSTVQYGDTLTLDEDENLIDIVMDLLADLSRRRDAHHHDLEVRASRYDLAEEGVPLRPREDVLIDWHCRLLDRVNGHGRLLCLPKMQSQAQGYQSRRTRTQRVRKLAIRSYGRPAASRTTGYRAWMLPFQPTDDDIEAMVIDALEALPAPFRDQLGSVAIVVEDEASAAQLASVGARGLYGLYQGIPRTRWSADGAPAPSKITIFRGPLVRANRTRERLGAAVADTVYHEIAHHFGISDERLHELQRGES